MATDAPSTTLRPNLPTTIRTERLLLRHADPDSDTDCILIQHVRDNVALMGAQHHHLAKDALRQIRHKHRVHGPRQEVCTRAKAPKGVYWLVYLAGNNEKDKLDDPIGIIVLSFRAEVPCPDLGYAIVGTQHGHGYAPEAGREVLRYWRDEVGVREVLAVCAATNAQSQRCAEKIGFVRGGGMMVEGWEGGEKVMEEGVVFVLPGMACPEGVVIRPRLGWPPEEEEVDDVGEEAIV